MSNWRGIDRRDLKLAALLGLLILAAVLAGTFRAGIEDLMRDMARPDPAPRPAVVRGTQRLLAGPAAVIDGDILEIDGRRIRLHGIDSPEIGQGCENAQGERYRCGRQAARALADLIGTRRVTCVVHGTGHPGHTPATCRTVTTNLNAAMVLNGHARADRDVTNRYVAEESVARHRKRGLWTGGLVYPTDTAIEGTRRKHP